MRLRILALGFLFFSNHAYAQGGIEDINEVSCSNYILSLNKSDENINNIKEKIDIFSIINDRFSYNDKLWMKLGHKSYLSKLDKSDYAEMVGNLNWLCLSYPETPLSARIDEIFIVFSSNDWRHYKNR